MLKGDSRRVSDPVGCATGSVVLDRLLEFFLLPLDGLSVTFVVRVVLDVLAEELHQFIWLYKGLLKDSARLRVELAKQFLAQSVDVIGSEHRIQHNRVIEFVGKRQAVARIHSPLVQIDYDFCSACRISALSPTSGGFKLSLCAFDICESSLTDVAVLVDIAVRLEFLLEHLTSAGEFLIRACFSLKRFTNLIWDGIRVLLIKAINHISQTLRISEVTPMGVQLSASESLDECRVSVVLDLLEDNSLSVVV